jgi:hypothetical protein
MGWACSECAWEFKPSGFPAGNTIAEMKDAFRHPYLSSECGIHFHSIFSFEKHGWPCVTLHVFLLRFTNRSSSRFQRRNPSI